MNEPSSTVDELANQVIGAAIEVHRVLGAGFLESVYEQALAIELAARNVPFERQKPVELKWVRLLATQDLTCSLGSLWLWN